MYVKRRDKFRSKLTRSILGTAWWQIPVLGMAYANLDLALGNRGNELLIKDLLSKNADQGYMIDRYVDDQSSLNLLPRVSQLVVFDLGGFFFQVGGLCLP